MGKYRKIDKGTRTYRVLYDLALNKRIDYKDYGFSAWGFKKFERSILAPYIPKANYGKENYLKEEEYLVILSDIERIKEFFHISYYNPYTRIRDKLLRLRSSLFLFDDGLDFGKNLALRNTAVVLENIFPKIGSLFKIKVEQKIETIRSRAANYDNHPNYQSKIQIRDWMRYRVEEQWWSRRFLECRMCKTRAKEDNPHFSHGYCGRCYPRSPYHRLASLEFDNKRKKR